MRSEKDGIGLLAKLEYLIITKGRPRISFGIRGLPFVLFLLGGTAVSIILFPLEEIVVPTCGNGCFL